MTPEHKKLMELAKKFTVEGCISFEDSCTIMSAVPSLLTELAEAREALNDLFDASQSSGYPHNALKNTAAFFEKWGR